MGRPHQPQVLSVPVYKENFDKDREDQLFWLPDHSALPKTWLRKLLRWVSY